MTDLSTWRTQVEAQDQPAPEPDVVMPFVMEIHEPSYEAGLRAGMAAAAIQCDKLARGMAGSGQADGAMYLATSIRRLLSDHPISPVSPQLATLRWICRSRGGGSELY